MTSSAVLQPPVVSGSPDASHLRVHTSDATEAPRKILLVEDDPAFQEIMRDFLTESGYAVQAVQNGVEGVHEVLASDFEVILCDMMMPTLPGDMFFRAVERMRPHLCERFVFMTGHRGNQKVNDFVSLVRGTMLTKPFQVDDLLEMIAFIQVRIALSEAAKQLGDETKAKA
jgi:CheY-like chemotaxis protein